LTSQKQFFQNLLNGKGMGFFWKVPEGILAPEQDWTPMSLMEIELGLLDFGFHETDG